MFSLRRRTQADADEVVTWIPDAEALFHFAGPRMTWPVSSRQLTATDRADGILAWVLVDDDELVGHFHLVMPQVGQEVPRLGRVIVRPDRRGEGLSHQLLKAAILQAGELGCNQLELLVENDNAAAISAYEAAGFVATDPSAEVTTMRLSWAEGN